MKVNKLWNLSLLLSRWIVSQGWQNFLQDWLNFDYIKRLIIVWMIRLIGFYSAWLEVVILGCSWITTKDRNQFWSPKERISIPPCLLSPELGRHAYITLSHVRLHYVEAGSKNKPLMLCLHGFPDFWYSWKNQLRSFSKTHWVVALDMRGYGDSDKPRWADKYQLSIIIEDIRQLIIKLIGNNRACVLMGHDMGALIGWIFAANHPNMLTHYISLSMPHPSAFRRHITSSVKEFIHYRHLFFFQMPWIPEICLKSEDNFVLESIAKVGLAIDQDPSDEIEAYKHYYSQKGAWNGPVNYYRRLFSPKSLLWQSDTQLLVRVPTLLLCSKHDGSFNQKMIGECAKHVNHFEYHFIEDSKSRWIHRENPYRVNELLASFLNVQL